MSGSTHFAKMLWELSPLTLEAKGDTALPLSQLCHHFIFAKLVPTPSGRASLVPGPTGCHSSIPCAEPEGATSSLRVWWDKAVQKLPEREPHPLWLKGRNQNNQNPSLLSSPCVLDLSSPRLGSLQQCLRCKQNSQKSFPALLRDIHIH